MSKNVRLYELSDAMNAVLESGGTVSFVTAGVSMLPMLRNRADKVVLRKPVKKPKRGDVIFFRRDDGSFVLHRIIAVKKDGYVLRGDNQNKKEYGVRDDQIIAVLEEFYRNGKHIKCTDAKYKAYCFFLPCVRFYRYKLYPIYVKIITPVYKIYKKLIGKNK